MHFFTLLYYENIFPIEDKHYKSISDPSEQLYAMYSLTHLISCLSSEAVELAPLNSCTLCTLRPT